MKLVARFRVEAVNLPKDYRGMTADNFEIVSDPVDFVLFILAVFFKLMNFYVYTVRQAKDIDDVNEEIWKISSALAVTEVPKRALYGEILPQAPYDYLKEARDDSE